MTPFETINSTESVISKPFFTLSPLSFGASNDILSIPQLNTDGTQNPSGFLEARVETSQKTIVGLQLDTDVADKTLNTAVTVSGGKGTLALDGANSDVKYGWDQIDSISYNNALISGKLYGMEIMNVPTSTELSTLTSNATTYSYSYDSSTTPTNGFLIGQITKNGDKADISSGSVAAEVNFGTNRVNNVEIHATASGYQMNLQGTNATLSNTGNFVMNNAVTSFCETASCTALAADRGTVAGQLIGTGTHAAQGIAGAFNASRSDGNWTASGLFGAKKQ